MVHTHRTEDCQRLLVLGTHNRKKGRELHQLLAHQGLELKTLADFPHALNVVEDGRTFAENAALKACRQACHLGHWVLGEDSGLAVDALDGAPGVFSARFSGPEATDASNNARLLAELAKVPRKRRTAHYVCHMVVADPAGQVRIRHEARCHGRIADRPAGSAGFGYDPLFEVIEYHRTFAQLGADVKSVLSHRGRAIRRVAKELAKLIAEGSWNELSSP